MATHDIITIVNNNKTDGMHKTSCNNVPIGISDIDDTYYTIDVDSNGIQASKGYVWNTDLLDWVPMVQPLIHTDTLNAALEGVSTEAKQDAIIENQIDGTQRTMLYINGADVTGYDNTTGNMVEIAHEHHEIHEGNRYDIIIDITGTSLIVAYKVGAKYLHTTFQWKSENNATFTLWRGATWTTNTGTAITPLNRNHNSSNVSTIEGDSTGSFVANSAVLNPTGLSTASATNIFQESVWSTNQTPAPSASGAREERILTPNQTYVCQISATSGGIWLHIDWYEMSTL